MNLLRESTPAPGYQSIVDDPKLASLIKFGLLNLVAGESHQEKGGEEEVCIVILGGECTVDAGEKSWQDVGGRRDVFDGMPHSVYVPRDTPFTVKAEGDCSAAICRAPARTKKTPELIPPGDVKCRSVGKRNWERRVCDIMGNDSAVPDTLIVGETFNPPGNWSSAPPHKHDVADLPRQSKLEEVYYFKLKPRQGFGFQRVYTADGEIDEAYVLGDGDVIAIPRGYHPVVAAPGYQLYYLWVLAGEERMMRPLDDPDHAWLKDCEPIISEMN
jgi:5-deoxy-glucuronate isomerase